MPYTRPTTDIAKEGLFNILQSNRDRVGLKTLDLFGGTGSISFEPPLPAVQRTLTIVEKDPQMLAFIRKTAETLGLTHFKIIPSDVFRFLKNTQETYDFIFAGPPYALETIDQIPDYISDRHLLKEKGWFVLEHTPRNRYSGHPLFVTERNYGTTIFSIFVNKKS